MRIGVIQKERVSTINYNPDLKDTGDLEAATKTITATAEASGVGSADYSAALTMAKPTDARLVVKRIAARLSATIDSMTATSIRCRVYVDAQAANNLLFDETWTTTGAKLSAVDVHAASKATIYDLLKDGSAHTFYVFLWVDAGNAVFSLMQLQEGVGTCTTDTMGAPATLIMTLEHTGQAQLQMSMRRVGSGAGTVRFYNTFTDYQAHALIMGKTAADYATWDYPQFILLNGQGAFRMNTSVATDINIFAGTMIQLRSVP